MGDPHNKDYGILGSILGSPLFLWFRIQVFRGLGFGFRDYMLMGAGLASWCGMQN